jgi:sarcosine oxidase subunit beta
VAERVGVLVVGGGIVGTALAWALAERGVRGVCVLDLDLSGVYASSELNAGGVRATWWQPVNIETCRETLDFFRAHAEQFGFQERGYLWLYEDAALYAQAREKRGLQNQAGLGVELLEPADVAARFPLLDRGRDRWVGATWSPRDGLINPNAVRAWLRRGARERGVVFRNRDYVTGVHTARVAGRGGSLRRVTALDVVRVGGAGAGDPSGLLREILTSHRVPSEAVAAEARIEAEVVVNCLGAWSPLLMARLGLPDPTEPVRRQISLVDVHRQDLAPGVALDGLGMIVLASGLYFHPEGAHLLAGFSTPDEAPGYDFEYDGREFFEAEVWPRLAERASSFERCGHVRGWAGLYGVTPDRSGIAGAVRGFTNLFEAHSFTGRGVMQSHGIAQAMASLLATGSYEGCDLSPLSRDRFADPARWVREDLHI